MFSKFFIDRPVFAMVIASVGVYVVVRGVINVMG